MSTTRSERVTIGTAPASALWASIKERHQLPPPPPYAEGWRTVKEVAVELDLTRATTERMLDTEVREGRMERVLARRGTATNQRTYYYRPKQPCN